MKYNEYNIPLHVVLIDFQDFPEIWAVLEFLENVIIDSYTKMQTWKPNFVTRQKWTSKHYKGE